MLVKCAETPSPTRLCGRSGWLIRYLPAFPGRWNAASDTMAETAVEMSEEEEEAGLFRPEHPGPEGLRRCASARPYIGDVGVKGLHHLV